MSPPETNALSPAPDNTTTRIASSAAKSSSTSAAASDISSENALRFSGLLKIKDPIAPSFFASILSLLMIDLRSYSKYGIHPKRASPQAALASAALQRPATYQIRLR